MLCRERRAAFLLRMQSPAGALRPVSTVAAGQRASSRAQPGRRDARVSSLHQLQVSICSSSSHPVCFIWERKRKNKKRKRRDNARHPPFPRPSCLLLSHHPPPPPPTPHHTHTTTATFQNTRSYFLFGLPARSGCWTLLVEIVVTWCIAIRVEDGLCEIGIFFFCLWFQRVSNTYVFETQVESERPAAFSAQVESGAPRLARGDWEGTS